MLYAIYGGHSDPERLKGILGKELGQFIQIRGTEPELVDEYLDKLVKKAVQVDLHVEAAKENISFEMHDPETRKLSGFIYKEDPVATETYDVFRNFELPDGRPIDFIKRPGMRLHGEGRGETSLFDSFLNYPSELLYHNYHQGGVVIPMLVVVDQYPDQGNKQDAAEKEAETEEKKGEEKEEEKA